MLIQPIINIETDSDPAQDTIKFQKLKEEYLVALPVRALDLYCSVFQDFPSILKKTSNRLLSALVSKNISNTEL